MRTGLLFAAALTLLLAACKDTRRETALRHLRENPPEGFEYVEGAGGVTLQETATGAEALATSRYRLRQPTYEVVDALTLPEGSALTTRLAEFRHWALTAVPPSHPVRGTILGLVADARKPLPARRIVTPAGTELDALATLQFTKVDGRWKIASTTVDARVPGIPASDISSHPDIDSDAVRARFATMAKTLDNLAVLRDRFLAERAERAKASATALRSILQTGATFEGNSAGATARIVVVEGISASGTATLTFSRRAGAESTLRFSGQLASHADGSVYWKSNHAEWLAPEGANAAGVSLSVSADATGGCVVEFLEPDRPPMRLALARGPAADLLPFVAP